MEIKIYIEIPAFPDYWGSLGELFVLHSFNQHYKPSKKWKHAITYRTET